MADAGNSRVTELDWHIAGQLRKLRLDEKGEAKVRLLLGFRRTRYVVSVLYETGGGPHLIPCVSPPCLISIFRRPCYIFFRGRPCSFRSEFRKKSESSPPRCGRWMHTLRAIVHEQSSQGNQQVALNDDQRMKLEMILEGSKEVPDELSDWETGFVSSFQERYELYKDAVFISDKQWNIFEPHL